MDLLKKSIEELTLNFTSRMDEFQREVRTSIPATSPSSNINAQFNAFRAFVLSALENLQLQLQLLSRQQDEMEVRTRRKMLLVHGMPEAQDENLVHCTSKVLSERLNIPELSVDSITRCHRLGRPRGDKPRVLLVKFQDQDLRDKVWFSKTKLKGSGGRHEAFVAARKRFGVSQCWTRDGYVVVLGSDGTKHRVYTVAEVIAIPDAAGGVPTTTSLTAATAAAASSAPKPCVTTARAGKTAKK
ncbi:unnamed protein product [Parnassius mnemosyne]|uniref:Uncharacterized protein n=1 Tax=Parnassius mnemosyne TaxID=213953 RepID=A0AAV1KNN3_9NEOP